MISLIQLEYIVALDSYRHFATAAEKSFVTQPTLSMQIKKLEEQLGLILFDRTMQPVVPTEAGRIIIDQARIVLMEAGKIELLVYELKQQVSGELRIGIIPTISPYLLPLFTGIFKSNYPAVDLIITETVTEKIEDLLVQNRIDVGLVVTPLKNKMIKEYPLFYEEMMLYHHEDHYLAKEQFIKLSDINPEEVWMLSDGHCFRNQVVNFCAIRKLKPSQLPFEFEGGSIDTLMKIIDNEGGYTLIPELASIGSLKSKQVKRFSGNKPIREVSLVYTRKFAKSKMVEVLADTIQKVVPPEMMNKERGVMVEWK